MKDKAEKYFNDLKGKKVILVDFDNTICVDEWPFVGNVVPGAEEVLKKLRKEGHRLILFTQRNDKYPVYNEVLEKFYSETGLGNVDGFVDLLEQPIQYCTFLGIEFDSVNENKEWEKDINDKSRKVFSDYIIDDHAVGMKYLKIKDSKGETQDVVDWRFIDEWLIKEGLYKESAFKK